MPLDESIFIRKYLSTTPESGFSAGDTVTFTNPQGVSFPNRRVIGFSDGKVHLSGDTPYWFGVPFSSIKKELDK